jgi:glycosyltransferase involved in cell wall biosynthesis
MVDILSPTEKKRRPSVAGAVFSIIIPTWNNLSYLKLCIDSLRKNSTLPHQVIVHINEGRDGTKEWVDAQPDIDYTFSEKNIGICYALNLTRELVTTDYIVYMNDDMYACPGWDEILYEEIKGIGHNLFFLSATPIEHYPVSNCSIKGEYGTDVGSFQEQKLLKEYASLPMPDWQGATWPPNVVHRDVWDLAGGYSIEFSPGWYSDPDFSMKLWQMGIRLFKGVSRSRVYHFGNKSTTRMTKKNKGYYMFISKWGMTSSTFTQFFLRRGEPYDGVLKDPNIGRALRLKNIFKRVSQVFRKL